VGFLEGAARLRLGTGIGVRAEARDEHPQRGCA
jgi:hypothetical protein